MKMQQEFTSRGRPHGGPPRPFTGAAPYRSRSGMVFGVCKGIAQYMDINVFWFRVVLVVAFFVTGMWMVGVAYVLAALVMKVEPPLPLETPDDEEFYNSYTSSRSLAIRRLKKNYEQLDRRIQRMEAMVTDKEYEWDQRLKQDK